MNSTSRTGVGVVKVAWLGSLLDTRAEGSAPQRKAAREALEAIDNDDRRGLVTALVEIAAVTANAKTRELATDTARAVSVG